MQKHILNLSWKSKYLYFEQSFYNILTQVIIHIYITKLLLRNEISRSILGAEKRNFLLYICCVSFYWLRLEEPGESIKFTICTFLLNLNFSLQTISIFTPYLILIILTTGNMHLGLMVMKIKVDQMEQWILCAL